MTVTSAPPPPAPPAPKPAPAPGSGRAVDVRLLGRLLPFIQAGPNRVALVVSILLLPVISGFEVLQPHLLQRAIDEHIAPHRLEGLDRLALFYLLALLGQYTAAFAHNYLVQVVGQRAMNDLRLHVHRHVVRLAAAFFDRTPVGALMTRMTNDIESLSEMFASGVISLAGDVVRLALIVAVMFHTDGKLAAFSMAAVPVLIAVAAGFRGWVRDAFREIRAKLSRMNGYLQEHLSGMKVVQAFAQEQRSAREFDVINSDYRRANASAISADAALYSVVEAVGSIAVAALLWHGGARIAAGGLTFGVLVQFIEYLSKFFAPLRDLSAKYTVMQQAMAAAERIFSLLDTKELDAAGAAAAPPVASAAPSEGTPAVEFDHVRFGYRADLPILQDLSLTIAPGETVAIVGPTGAGKSTLIKLLPRLYAPQSGTIRIDGRDIASSWDVAELRRRVVVVSQDVFLFAGTLADNIGLGDPTIDRQRMLDAARRVGADRVIAARPQGLDAPVVERGANFSAGERQLISFARALARDPRLLILDEATASVDPQFERLIEAGIAELMRGRTSIVIAHRLSTIRRADRIVVLEGGRVVEQGHHQQLLAHDGMYARLYRLQMSAQRTHAALDGDGDDAASGSPPSGI
jgi:ATP-binding cassette, subfamily B, multidrug efflux pump